MRSPVRAGVETRARVRFNRVMRVDRCICHSVPFAECLRLARDEGLSHGEIVTRTGCTTGCGLCDPYVRLTLACGRTVWPLMRPEALESELERLEGGG